MSVIVQSRHRQLRHHLDATQAATRTDEVWLIARARRYAAVAAVTVEVTTDAREYARRTGLQVSPTWAGDTYLGLPGARIRVPLIYLNPQLMATHGQAELVIAHEMMHARWPSYGHRPIAFDRAQKLIDTVAG